MATFKPDGFRSLSGDIRDCAESVDRASSSLLQTGLRGWHPQPSSGYDGFRDAWGAQLRSVAGDLRSLSDDATSLADILDDADETFGSAFGPGY